MPQAFNALERPKKELDVKGWSKEEAIVGSTDK